MARRDDVAVIATRAYWREADGRAVVAAWRRSGESRRRFAGRWGIAPARLARWIARMDTTASGEPVTFHPVRIRSTPESAAGPVGSPIEIALPDGAVIRLPIDAPASAIRRVVRAVRGAAARC